MVAYAAVVSLLQNVDSILHPGARRWRIFHNRAQLKSLREKVSFLLDFLENSSSHYGRNKDPELKILETMMRDAACKAEYIIESDITNQLLAEKETFSVRTSPLTPFVYLLILLAIGKLCYVAFQKVIIDVSIQTLIPVMGVIPVSVQSCLLPFTFQIVIPFLTYTVLHCLIFIVSVISSLAGYVMQLVVLKGISFTARYWLYSSQSENQDLRLAIDDISSIMEEVTKIKDASNSGHSAEDSDSADGLSRWDFRGMGRNVVVGLGGDLKEINYRLFGNQSELEVVSIVGMGGIGKTTLARQVHDAPYIVDHFDICAWVTVSQEYSLKRVMLGLLGSAKIRAEEIQQQNHKSDDDLCQKLGEHLHKNLMSRRYLVVMDDLWDTKIWDFVRIFFPDNNNGSRVLLTTRLLEVASYANSGILPLQMQSLNTGDSWNLLREKVFGGEDCPLELEAVGRTIASKCEGLPLAIVALGGLLYNEHRTPQDWTRVSKNLNSILSTEDEHCSKILGLSYNHLPPRLKACFLYMGAFRKDEEICVTRLFNLWAAEGFLEVSKSKNLEEVAEEYLEDLIQRSLIMVGMRSWNGKIRTCKIHNLIRNVCLQNAQKENFLDFANREGAVEWRGLTDLLFAHDNDDSDDSRSFYLMARSFTCDSENMYDLSHIYLRFRLLRVLDVVQAALYEFPDAIFELFHLRYLGLTCDCHLPPSISQLRNLHTIAFHNGRLMGVRIPVEIWSLPNLRHLYFTKGLLPNPPGWRLLGNNKPALENLQSLVGILDFRCTEGIIKRIPNVKKLEISYDVLSSVDWSGYELESLVNLCQLETLKITVRCINDHWTSFPVHPPKLAFPEKLKKLSLSGCRIPWESMRIVGALPNLRVLKLRDHAYEGRIWEPVEGEFCQLEFLLIDDTDLEHWRCNETHFPHLQSLLLRRCRQLKGIPSSIGEISTLQMIQLVDCHPSAVDSAKQVQEEQESMGNVDLKVCIGI